MDQEGGKLNNCVIKRSVLKNKSEFSEKDTMELGKIDWSKAGKKGCSEM
jgi:hypothetical protein